MDPMYPGYPGMVPAGPGFMGPTLQSFGATNPSPVGLESSQYSLASQQASMMGGAAPLNWAVNRGLPLAGSALTLGSMTLGPLLAEGGRTGFQQGLGRGLLLADPFTWAMPGAKFGYTAGRTFMGLGSGLAGAGQAFADRGLLSTGLRYGAAGMMGAAGAAVTMAPLLAAQQAISWGAGQVWEGAQNTMAGQNILSQMAPSIGNVGNNEINRSGAGIGDAMHDVSRSLRTSVEDVGGMIKTMDQMRLFQTTSSIKEFEKRFKEVLSAVKDVAKSMQSTLEEATGTFGALRNQGFYTTADITAQAAKTHAREMTTGISSDQYAAIGGVGTQNARAYGMRGRFGAEHFQNSVAGVARALKMGAMSEEDVMEMGGVEAAGMQMAQHQMGFLSTARGRALIAATMGKGGRPDLGAMSKLLSGGSTIEDIVTTAAGRGLDTLRMAGTAQAREQYLPYAGMMMVQMAAAQQRQLFGGVTERGTLGMLGTMGIGRREGRLMIQQAMSAPDQLLAEANAQQATTARSNFQDLDYKYSYMRRFGEWAHENFGAGLQEFGSNQYQNTQRAYQGLQRAFSGYEEFKGGDSRLARDYFARGNKLNFSGEVSDTGGFFGPNTAQQRLRAALPSSAKVAEYVARQRGAENYMFLGDGEAVSRADLNAYGRGAGSDAPTLSKDQERKLSLAISRGDLLDKLGDAHTQTFGYTPGVGTPGNTEFRTWFLAKTAGLTTENFEIYNSKASKFSVEDKVRLQKMLANYMEGQDDTRLKKLIPGVEGGLGSLGSISSERGEFKEKLSGLLNGLDDGSILGPMFGKKGALTEALHTSGAARDAFAAYMQAITSGKPEDIEAADKLAKESGMGKQAYEALQGLRRSAEDSNSFKAQLRAKWGGEGGFKDLLGRRAAAESVFDEMGRTAQMSEAEYKRVKRGESKQSKTMQELVSSLHNLAVGGENATGYRSKVNEIFKEAISSGGSYSPQEESFLNEILGDHAGSKVGDVIRGLTSGDERIRKKQLKALGIDDKNLEVALSGKDAGKKQDAIIQALSKGLGGAIDPGMLKGREGGKDEVSVANTMTTYVQANTEFVTAVHRFASAMGYTDLKTDSTLQGGGPYPDKP